MSNFLFFLLPSLASKKKANMANITDAERITHKLTKQTATAISWSGGLTILVALFASGFQIWTRFAKDRDEEKRRKRADTLDRARRRTNDDEDQERRRREDEERNMILPKAINYTTEHFCPLPAWRKEVARLHKPRTTNAL